MEYILKKIICFLESTDEMSAFQRKFDHPIICVDR